MKLFIVVLLALSALALGDNASKKPKDLRPFRHVCFLKPDAGPCEAAISKWFYNRKTRRCEKFIYGGCKGNGNRFDSKQDCLKRCGRTRPPVDKCKLKADPGLCKAAIPRWFFNAKKGKCEIFTYGGCGGNANNFNTKAECLKACSRGPIPFPRPHPKLCGKLGASCLNPDYTPKHGAITHVYIPPCCRRLVCCACPPPVIPQDYTPPKLGKCQKECRCLLKG